MHSKNQVKRHQFTLLAAAIALSTLWLAPSASAAMAYDATVTPFSIGPKNDASVVKLPQVCLLRIGMGEKGDTFIRLDSIFDKDGKSGIVWENFKQEGGVCLIGTGPGTSWDIAFRRNEAKFHCPESAFVRFVFRPHPGADQLKVVDVPLKKFTVWDDSEKKNPADKGKPVGDSHLKISFEQVWQPKSGELFNLEKVALILTEPRMLLVGGASFESVQPGRTIQAVGTINMPQKGNPIVDLKPN